MTAPDYPVFDGDGVSVPPRRPSLDDLGGATLIDSSDYPPDTETMPYAGELNQWQHVQAGLARVAPAALVEIRFSGGTPSVFRVLALGSEVGTGDFALTDNGNGDTTVTVASGLLPTLALRGSAAQTDDTEIDRIRCITVSALSWRVKTKLGATGTDADFVLSLW